MVASPVHQVGAEARKAEPLVNPHRLVVGGVEKREVAAVGEMPPDELARLIKDLESQMKEAAKQLEFERAAALRDEVVQLRGIQVLELGPEAGLAGGPTTKRVVRRRRGI